MEAVGSMYLPAYTDLYKIRFDISYTKFSSVFLFRPRGKFVHNQNNLSIQNVHNISSTSVFIAGKYMGANYPNNILVKRVGKERITAQGIYVSGR